jgi:hypothetical protein
MFALKTNTEAFRFAQGHRDHRFKHTFWRIMRATAGLSRCGILSAGRGLSNGNKKSLGS